MTKRYVVWSARVQTCMAWDSRGPAERFAEFWRDTALLGCRDWRVSALVDEPVSALGQPQSARVRMPPRSAPADAANDALIAARDELLELIAQRDALIAELQGKLNESRLAMARESASQGRRIAELESQLAASDRGRTRTR